MTNLPPGTKVLHDGRPQVVDREVDDVYLLENGDLVAGRDLIPVKRPDAASELVESRLRELQSQLQDEAYSGGGLHNGTLGAKVTLLEEIYSELVAWERQQAER
jgi:hypothetical protein